MDIKVISCCFWRLTIYLCKCYPKCDGTGYTYDPSDKMTELQVEDFMEEIRSKVLNLLKLFKEGS